MRAKLALAAVAGLALLGLVGLAASPTPTATPLRHDYASFKIISDRNIFNTNRSRGSRGGSSDENKPAARVESFTLVGTMSYEKGLYAFFDGSSAEFRKVLEPGKSIGEYKIAEVTANAVTLEAGTNRVQLQVGAQMRREDEGPWQMSGGTPSSPSSPTAAASDAAGDENDIIKRLMQQREQELK